MIKILNLKFVILLEFQNIKIVFHKSLFQVDLKKFLLLQKSKALCGGYILLVIIKAKKYLKRFTKNKFKKQIKKKKNEKVIRRKDNNLYVKWKGYDNFFNSWIDKKRHGIKERYFSEPESLGRRVKVELDFPNYIMSNYVTKADLKDN